MTKQELLDFLGALGEEFCEAISPPVGDAMICPQDGYEVWLRAFGEPPSPTGLAQLSNSQLTHLRAECERYFECPGIRTEHVQQAVRRTLARWPVDSEQSGAAG
jgi:hypothetical protein